MKEEKDMYFVNKCGWDENDVNVGLVFIGDPTQCDI